jgi:hypothetical protein
MQSAVSKERLNAKNAKRAKDGEEGRAVTTHTDRRKPGAGAKSGDFALPTTGYLGAKEARQVRAGPDEV